VEVLTKQGYDGQFGTNVLGMRSCPFRAFHSDRELTKLLSHRSLLPHGVAAPHSDCHCRGLGPRRCAHRKRILYRTQLGHPSRGYTLGHRWPEWGHGKAKEGRNDEFLFPEQTCESFHSPCGCRHTRHWQGNVLITNELARRVSNKNIIAISLHPGNINSSPEPWNIIVRILLRLAFYDIAYGVISLLYAGTAPAAAELNGKVTTILSPIQEYVCEL
jgi:hypothetical protein